MKSKLLASCLAIALVVSYVVQFQVSPAYAAPISAPPAPAALSPLTWQFNSLAPGQSVTMRFTVRMDASVSGVVRNIASVSPNELPAIPSNETVNTVQPTAIRLVSFTTERVNGVVRIAWRTSSEIDTYGFYVLRSTSPNPESAARVNVDLVTGKGSQGGSYELLDTQAEAGQTYYYWLEEMEWDASLHVYNDWMRRVVPVDNPGNRSFKVYTPLLMR